MSPVLLEDSPVNPIVLERAPCTLGSFGLCWGEMEEVGRARVARQHSPYSGKINPRIMERRDPFLACCLFLSSSVVRLARIPAAASREQRDLFVLQRTKRFILGDENWDFWICWGRGLAETGTPGFGRKRDCGKSQFLISGHIPLMYHLLLANICVFALSPSPRKCFVVPALNRAEVGVGLCLD